MKKQIMVLGLIFTLPFGVLSCNLFSPDDSVENIPPTIQSLKATFAVVPPGGNSIVTCLASDPNDLELFYIWQATDGELSSTRNTAVWKSQNETGLVTIKAIVSDIWGAATEATIVVQVSEEANRVDPGRILVDASHGGGVWWFPQSSVGGFSPDEYHQGQALANRLRALGYEVDELARGVTITSSLLSQYDKVIRAGKYGDYLDTEIQAYLDYVEREDASLIFISEYLRPDNKDELAEALGLPFRGLARGWVANYEYHSITQQAVPFEYIAGSVLLDPDSNPDIEVLGRLRDADFVDLNGNDIKDPDEQTGSAVLGILHSYPARIFFLGEMNGIEQVPQPLVDNLVSWAFEHIQ